MRVHHLNNVNRALQLLEQDYSVSIVTFVSNKFNTPTTTSPGSVCDVVRGTVCLTLGVVLTKHLRRYWW